MRSVAVPESWQDLTAKGAVVVADDMLTRMEEQIASHKASLQSQLQDSKTRALFAAAQYGASDFDEIALPRLRAICDEAGIDVKSYLEG